MGLSVKIFLAGPCHLYVEGDFSFERMNEGEPDWLSLGRLLVGRPWLTPGPCAG
jgi:hypothetical protein